MFFRIAETNTDHSTSPPFGSVMSERSWTAANGYRYGFNGKEKDDEFSVEDGSYDFGARMYDARLGRWWSVDGNLANSAVESTYSGISNSPLIMFDPDGNDAIVVIDGNTITYKARILISGEGATSQKAKEIQEEILKFWTPSTVEFGNEKFTVKFEVEVISLNEVSVVPMDGDNHIQMKDGDPEYRSNVSIQGNKGVWSTQPYNDHTYAHEFGHLLGFDDAYITIIMNKKTAISRGIPERERLKSEKSIQYESAPKNELMGTGNKVTERDIEALVVAAWQFKFSVPSLNNIWRAKGMPLNKPTLKDQIALEPYMGSGQYDISNDITE